MTEGFPKAVNWYHYTFSFEGEHTSPIAARASFNRLLRQGELAEDSKYRVIRKGDRYGLFIWR